MMTDALLRREGMNILSDKLGLIEAERFVALIKSDSFDYTEWHQNLYEDMPIEDLCSNASRLWNETH